MVDAALLDLIADLASRADRPCLIGIAGAQGSGKSTLAKAAAERLGGVVLSLDDVYLTRRERAALAEAVHPLLAVRGPPGTHDLDLADSVIDDLLAGRPTDLPRFDKLRDDRTRSEPFMGRAAVVILEGWCVGATPQDETHLAGPINALEHDHDPDGAWRRRANVMLEGRYARFFDRFDAVLHLAAPDFGAVLDWRCEQEAGLLGVPVDALPYGRRDDLATFIQHFERITRHMLAGGVRATATARLGVQRRVLSIERA